MKFVAPVQDLRWHRFKFAVTLHETVAAKIIEVANAAIASKGSFHIVLAGGNTPRDTYTLLRKAQTDWQKWHVYFSDERCAPFPHPSRNDAMADGCLFVHVPVPREQIHRIPSELPAAECVEQYTQTLEGIERFDLVLLGLGEDGHTASLFPNRNWGKDENSPAVLSVHYHKVDPPDRISMSVKRLNAAEHVWFIITGRNKQDALMRWQNGDFLPVSYINPPGGIDVFVST